ncbi:phage tail sheath subtilisin-like domain-containing protein [Aeromonas dhakensis]|uniref:phage tail sheath subtilisin-like domain-containing protein n=1 Tax=Aeromonas dhakensis TaxID=196024 RepID=UPI002B4A9C81|nr:phage tail sheath subtilisin-like domain-containing protein [Aeromonas dhakensis]
MPVSLNNIPADLRVPLFYAEMDNSAANSASETLRALVLGHGLASVTTGKNQLQQITNPALAAGLVGAGSQLAAMVAAYRNVDSFGELWLIDVPEPSAGTAATATITVTGTAISAGVVSLYIAGKRVQAGVSASAAATAVASSIKAAIDADTSLPVTAAVSAGVVTVTAKWKGLTGNDINITLNYRGVMGGESLPNGINVVPTVMSGGAGSPDLSAAIAAMGDEPFDFIATPWHDSGSLDVLEAEMNDATGRWSWLRQIYGHLYSAKRGTMAELSSFGRARNGQHVTMTDVEPLAAVSPYEVAAATCARNAVFIRIDPARPTQTGELNGLLPAPTGKRFTTPERQVLLSSGIATQTVSSGVMMVERACTMYQRNKYGSADDSYFDSETLHLSAYIIRRLRRVITSKYGRHKLGNDGTRFGDGQAIVTPAVIKGELIGEYRLMEREGLVENSELFAKYLIVERDQNNPSRVNVLFPPDYVNGLRVFALLNQFRLQYQEAA